MTTPAIPYTRRKLLADIEAHAPVTDDATTLFTPQPTLAQVQAAAETESAFGINFAGNVYEDWRWHGPDGYIALMREARCAYVNMTGAGQYNEATSRALETQAILPHIRILWRHMIHQPPGAVDKTDKGMWRLPYREFVDNIIIAHNYHTRGWYTVTDCEGHINAGELADYARMEKERLDYGVPKGCRFAVLRMSTHHPTAAVLNSGVLDPLLEAIKANMGDYDNPNVVISNNGYFDDNNVDGLKTATLIERRCRDKFGFVPVIVMGEYNYDKGITSEHGPNAEGMSAAVLSGKLNARYNEHLKTRRVLVYCIGIGQDKKVKNFHLENEAAKVVLHNAPRFEKPAMIQPTKPVPALPGKDADVWKDATLIVDLVRLRNMPFTKQPTFTPDEGGPGVALKVLATLPKNTKIKVWHDDTNDLSYESDDLRWYGVWDVNTGHIGWMALVRDAFAEQFVLTEAAPKPPPVEQPPPIEEPPVDPDDTQPAPPVVDVVLKADFLRVLQIQYNATKLRSDNIKADMEALDKEANQLQAQMLELEALIEAYTPEAA